MTEPTRAVQGEAASGRQTHWSLAWRRLRRNRIAMAGFWMLVLLYIGALLADFIAPYATGFSDRSQGYHPPSRIHWRTPEGQWVGPYVYATERQLDQTYREIPGTRYPVRWLAPGEAHKLFGLIPMRVHLFEVESPARVYLFGSDQQGRDLFSRILYGSRISMTIGLVGVLLTYSLGMLLGGISGYFGGWVDNIFQRFGELLMTFPSFYLLLALRGTIAGYLPSDQVYLMVVVILSFVSWPGVSRIVRGLVLSLREQEFVQSARAIGASPLRIIVKDILPNTFSQVIVLITLSIPGYIISESALSFLNLGVTEPQVSWGLLLSDAQDLSSLLFYPWVLVPGLFIFIAVLSFNVLGDGLRDALDPKARE